MSTCRYCTRIVPPNCRNCPLCGFLTDDKKFNFLSLRRTKRKYCGLCYSGYIENYHTYCWNCGKKYNFLSSHL